MKLTSILLTVSFAACFSRAADEPLAMNSSTIQGWATGLHSVQYGSDTASEWKTPHKSLGHADGDAFGVVALGRGGQITLSFSPAIINGDGPDLAVFENGISDTFLELGWVEVSSDGTHFVRFLNFSQTAAPIGTYGNVDSGLISGLAGKYRQGFGTQFDLNQLQLVYDDQTSASPVLPLSSTFRTRFLENFPHLNLNDIRYVRIIDIVGDGSAQDAYGNVIYDPYPTTGSAGFDLDAIAALHAGTQSVPPPVTFINWAAGYRLSGDGTADYDSDGSTDLEEYFLGSNPTNSTDTATFTGTAFANRFDIAFNLNPDARGTIDIETVHGITQTNWVAITPDSIVSNVTAEAIGVTVSLPLTAPNQYFRLRFNEETQ